MNNETSDDLPFDEYVPWNPGNDSEDDAVQDLFDQVDSLQGFST
ncbi:hypothetical protein [Bremerella sp.]